MIIYTCNYLVNLFCLLFVDLCLPNALFNHMLNEQCFFSLIFIYTYLGNFYAEFTCKRACTESSILGESKTV